jgi:hypothetical protein
MRRSVNLSITDYNLEFSNVAFVFSEYIVAKTCSRSAAAASDHVGTAGGERQFSLIPAGHLGNRNFVQCAEIWLELGGRVRKSIRLQDEGDDVGVRVIAEAVGGQLRHR